LYGQSLKKLSVDKNKPYTQISKGPDCIVRTFSCDIPESELKWHWDEEDRHVTPLKQNDWYFQFDNQLPIPINQTIIIPRGTIHRIIKGTTDLVVEIKFV
jgi:hypothetical protein